MVDCLLDKNKSVFVQKIGMTDKLLIKKKGRELSSQEKKSGC